MKWTAADVPDQSGRLAIITGANSGIGYETARVLAGKGAGVVLACRNAGRAREAAERIQGACGPGEVTALGLDLARLDSVRQFADQVASLGLTPDLLINNAGIMMPPPGKTPDGFELQIGTNHLGHFALTALLIGYMKVSRNTRVVTVSSLAHQSGRLDFDSFRFGGGVRYDAFREYRQSKLANLVFATEFDRRLKAAGSPIQSLAAHPGITRTNLVRHKPFFDLIASVIGMSAERGALPTLFAATDVEARGGGYYGPGGFHEMWGYPSPARVRADAAEPEAGRALWEASESLTGIRFAL